jgi:hypothetical protein
VGRVEGRGVGDGVCAKEWVTVCVDGRGWVVGKAGRAVWRTVVWGLCFLTHTMTKNDEQTKKHKYVNYVIRNTA